MAGMIETWTVNGGRYAPRVRGWATLPQPDVADYLAKRGLPFRGAHAVVGHLVLDVRKAWLQP